MRVGYFLLIIVSIDGVFHLCCSSNSRFQKQEYTDVCREHSLILCQFSIILNKTITEIIFFGFYECILINPNFQRPTVCEFSLFNIKSR